MDIASTLSLLTAYLGGIGILLVVVGLITSLTRFGHQVGGERSRTPLDQEFNLPAAIWKLTRNLFRRAFGKRTKNWERITAIGFIFILLALVCLITVVLASLPVTSPEPTPPPTSPASTPTN